MKFLLPRLNPKVKEETQQRKSRMWWLRGETPEPDGLGSSSSSDNWVTFGKDLIPDSLSFPILETKVYLCLEHRVFYWD